MIPRSQAKRVLVTGGAGFIGSAVVERLLEDPKAERLVVLDLLTYAGHRENLAAAFADPRFTFVHGDVCDASLVARLFAEEAFDAVLHLAAESHVDRSIDDAAPFVRTNVLGTHVLLDAARSSWGDQRDARFVHVSTDEVYGSLAEGDRDARFTEASPYAPSSPYAASKAAADLLVLAYVKTYSFPAVVTHGANTYGPRQQPEKLVPVALTAARDGRAIPVYGDGRHVREWLWVFDHADGILGALARGVPGATYNLAGESERTNLETVGQVADAVDAALGRAPGTSRARIAFVRDRPGHDFRYACDGALARAALGFSPRVAFDDGLARTVRWYIGNAGWPPKA